MSSLEEDRSAIKKMFLYEQGGNVSRARLVKVSREVHLTRVIYARAAP